MSKRRLQELYDKRRCLEEKIEEHEIECRELGEEQKRTLAAIATMENKRDGLKRELRELRQEEERNKSSIRFEEARDLVKDEKIKWQDMSKEEWEKSDCVETLWEFKKESDDHRVGIWVGLSKLSKIDVQHWEDYKNDYFYYGWPKYYDINDEFYGMSECQSAFASGAVTLDCYDGYEKEEAKKEEAAKKEAAKEKERNEFLEGATKEQLKKRCRELMEEAASMKKQKC